MTIPGGGRTVAEVVPVEPVVAEVVVEPVVVAVVVLVLPPVRPVAGVVTVPETARGSTEVAERDIVTQKAQIEQGRESKS